MALNKAFLLLATAAFVLCLALDVEGRRLPLKKAMKKHPQAKRQDFCPIPFECEEDSMKCITIYGGDCIPRYWICDGLRDCFDGLDERYCGSRKRSADPALAKMKKSCIEFAKRGKLNTRQESNGTDALFPCSDDSFHCENPYGQCLPPDWKCDTIQDCYEGEDEQNCNTVTSEVWETYPCHEGAFHCDNPYGSCMPPSWECDGVDDCYSGIDEHYCGAEEGKRKIARAMKKRKLIHARQEESVSEFQVSFGTCGESSIHCANHFGIECLPGNWRCDGIEDCIDGYDEVDCESSSIFYERAAKIKQLHARQEDSFSEFEISFGKCGANSISCVNHFGVDCIPGYWRCDGVEDCLNGQDETDCESSSLIQAREEEQSLSEYNPSWAKFVCTDNSFQCESIYGECIPSAWVCDFVEDCTNGEDEKECESSEIVNVALPSWEQYSCSIPGAFHCPNPYGECMTGAWVCDGVADCYDGKDEIDCGKRKRRRRSP